MIKAATPGTGHMGNHAIHHLSPLLIAIEVLIQKMAEIASGLRDADRIHPMHRSNRLLVMFQVRKKITHCRQANARYCRIFRGVNDLVNLSGKESAVQVNEVRIICQLAICLAREAPLIARDGLSRAGGRVAYGQNIERA